MKIVTPNRPVHVESAGFFDCYRPYTRYVVSDWEYLNLLNNTPEVKWSCSSFNPFERRYGGQPLGSKKVVVYRHTAYGDQLMISSVPRYLKTLYPQATVHFYCDSGMRNLWDNNPFVGGSAIPVPMPLDAVRQYDYQLFYEGILENNSERDQNCCYDDFFGMMGMNNVPDIYKRPYIEVQPSDYNWATSQNIDLSGKYLVYHLTPANKNRCYPPIQGRMFLELFIQQFPDWKVYVLGHGSEHLHHFKDLFDTNPKVINLIDRTPKFRDVIPIVEKASLVVCPDSSVMHLAACFPLVKVISLWGIFSSNDRAQYYPNHHALESVGVCPHAPCRNHDFKLPVDKCKDALGYRKDLEYCCAMSTISPEHIMKKALEVI